MGYDDYAFVISWIIMIIYEAFIKSPAQATNQNLLPITKNFDYLENKTPKRNADKTRLEKSTNKVPKSKEIASLKEAAKSSSGSQETAPECSRTPFLYSRETTSPRDKCENAQMKESISNAKNAAANSVKKRPVTTISKIAEDISTSQSCRSPAEIKPTVTNGRYSKSKSEKISLSSPRSQNFKSNSEEIRVPSPSGCKAARNRPTLKKDSKSKSDNKKKKQPKSVSNRRETSEEGNVDGSRKKNNNRSSSTSLSPPRLPTKLFDNITSSREPKDKKLDLHGYFVDEAIQKFQQFYQKMKKKYHSENCEEDDRYIYIVTGRGNGCPDGIPKIKPEIQNIILTMKIRHNWLNDGGLVMIDFCGQHEEMDPMELRKLTRMNRPRRKDKKKKGRNRNKGVIHDI